MGLIGLILGLALVGFLVYLIVTYIPMPEPFKNVIVVIVIIVVILYLISAFGLLDIPIPRFHR
jgi:hypothetical protein